MGLGLIAAASALLIASPASGEGAPQDGPVELSVCGGPGQPPCPLQAYMRVNVATPLASNNVEALATGLDRVRRFAPDPTWTSWASFAAEGAAAARARDVPRARAACKGCHEAWRDKYRATYRALPLPR
jgi:cytochrome c553